MISDFFQIGALPPDQLNGFYDLRLVILSFLVAAAASYIALDMAGRLRDLSNTPRSKKLWLLGGSIAMGSGIWSMHFIGMLSFTIPGLDLRYDMFWTILSLVVAIVASGFALFLLQSSVIRLEHYIAGGVILGLAIASMHYTGMQGMLISLYFRYLPSLFFLSILIAIIASEAALWLALKSNQVILRFRARIKLISALIMGVAICGMHYTGMAASVFTPLCVVNPITDGSRSLDPTYLSIVIAAVTFIILSVAFFASSYKESINQAQFENARQLGMAEISASVLHSVGNVLNSVNVSASTVAEKITHSKLVNLPKLAELLNENKNNLSEFLASDKGIKAIEYFSMLANYWKDEQKTLSEQMTRLLTNIKLIKDIVSTQQELSKTTEIEQIISVNDLLDEAILITGLNQKNDIILQKKYGRLGYTKIDKVKLLQVFVNILRNAKEAVRASSKETKIINVITSSPSRDKIKIEIEDNGVGILSKNLTQVFSYGFTTKEAGHGFGLHTSALAINALGGSIKVESKGLEQGAKFVMIVPCRLDKNSKQKSKK